MKIYECLTHRKYEGMISHYATLDKLDAERWIEDNPDSWGEICVWLNGEIIERTIYNWIYDVEANKVVTVKDHWRGDK